MILFLSALHPAFTQEQAKDSQNVSIYQDKRVDELVQKQIKLSETNNNLDGFRIQIFSDSGNNSKTRAQTAMDRSWPNTPRSGLTWYSNHPITRSRLAISAQGLTP